MNEMGQEGIFAWVDNLSEDCLDAVMKTLRLETTSNVFEKRYRLLQYHFSRLPPSSPLSISDGNSSTDLPQPAVTVSVTDSASKDQSSVLVVVNIPKLLLAPNTSSVVTTPRPSSLSKDSSLTASEEKEPDATAFTPSSGNSSNQKSKNNKKNNSAAAVFSPASSWVPTSSKQQSQTASASKGDVTPPTKKSPDSSLANKKPKNLHCFWCKARGVTVNTCDNPPCVECLQTKKNAKMARCSNATCSLSN